MQNYCVKERRPRVRVDTPDSKDFASHGKTGERDRAIVEDVYSSVHMRL